MKRLIGLLVASLMLLSACATPALQQAAPQDKPQGQFRLALETLGSPAFDPAVAAWTAQLTHQFIYDTLIGLDAEGNYTPKRSIAESWTASADQKSYTFKIRDGVTFSNGDKLTAEDVVYSLARLKESWVTSPDGVVIAKNIKDITAPDPRTVVVTINQPSLVWFSYLSTRSALVAAIVPKKHVESVGREAFNRSPIGSGPYKIEKYQPGVSVTLVPSADKHWDIGTPRWAKIELNVVPEEATRRAMLQSGQVDAASISRGSIPQLTTAKMSIFTNKDQLATFMVPFNTWQKNLPTSDARVRKALSMAIDREALCKNLLQGACETGWISMPYTWDPARKNFSSAKDWPYDPAQAKALLKEAGYADGFDIQLWSGSLAGLAEAQDLNEAIAGMWRSIGLRAKITPIDYSAWVNSTWCVGPNRQDLPMASMFLNPYGNRFWTATHAAILYGTEGRCTVAHDAALNKLVADGQNAQTEEEYIKVTTALGEKVKADAYATMLFQTGPVFAADPAKLKAWPFPKIPNGLGLRDLTSTAASK